MNIWRRGHKMEFDTATTLRGIQNLQFNPGRFPHATLKAFNKLIE